MSDALIVVDESLHPLGVLSERAIRKALLRGASLRDPVVGWIQPVIATEDEPFALRPVGSDDLTILVDEQGTVSGITNFVDPAVFPAETLVVLMVGGAGTRLQPLTDNCPKPLLPVQGRPLLEVTVEQLASFGFNRFCMTVGYRAEMICSHFGDGSRWGVEISYIHERERLGTCGALRLLPERPKSSIIVMNGDLITTINYPKLLSFHSAAGGKATVCAHRYEQRTPYGVIDAKGDALSGMQEKPLVRSWINAGIYVLEPELIDTIPPTGAFDMPNLLGAVQAAGERVSVYALRERWIDIGSIEEYERANASPGILPVITRTSEQKRNCTGASLPGAISATAVSSVPSADKRK